MCEALLGFLGALVGAFAAISGIYIAHRLEDQRRDRVDEPRRSLLRQMLDDPKHEWRKMETLSNVIGASRGDTARLLIEIGARRNEKSDGEDVWGYLKDHPLP